VNPHGLAEVENAAGKAGFTLETVHGGFQGEAHDDPKSADLLHELVKKKGITAGA
jgi:hypothetical protein